MARDVNLLISSEGLQALAEMSLTIKDQSRLDQLLAQNAEGKISAECLAELDSLLRKIDELNLVKASAALRLGGESQGG